MGQWVLALATLRPCRFEQLAYSTFPVIYVR